MLSNILDCNGSSRFARMAIMTLGYPVATTLSTVANVAQQIIMSGIGFRPAAGFFTVVAGALSIPSVDIYECSYRLSCQPNTAASFNLSLYYDSGSGYTFLPLSDIYLTASPNDRNTLGGNYMINVITPNTKIGMFLTTTQNESLTNVQVFMDVKNIGVVGV